MRLTELRFDPAIRFLLLGFSGLILFYLYPFLISVCYAFLDKPVHGSFVGINNFIDLFHNKSYLLGLKNTFIFICLSIPLGMVLSLAVAMLISRVPKHKTIFTLIFLIPLVIPSGSMVFFWKSLFANDGYINGILHFCGFAGVEWFETSAAMVAIILIFVWKNLGYNMILFLAGIHNVPKEYGEAAAVDGAGAWQIFLKITLPNLTPTFVLVTIMSVINSFKVFKEIYLITGNYPDGSIYMLQHFMNNMFFSLNYPKLTTATCVLVLIIAVLVQFLLKFERRRAE